MDIGPKTAFADAIHAEKHRGPGESFAEAVARVSNATKDDDEHFVVIKEILGQQRFLQGGRVQAAMGAPKIVTPYNCFVSGTIPDSMDGIMDRAKEAAQTMRMGGGIGYDFSTLRPRLDIISTLGSPSSGPVSFMEIFDAVCGTVSSAGNRRGAQMSVLRVDHPDIEEFITAKHNQDRLTNFNISVGVTDEFMYAVRNGGMFSLRFGGRHYKMVDARNLWELIMRSTWDWAEPGVLFIDRINEENNLAYCEHIAATNPCGEQPLPPYGACLLGSFNLTKYVRDWWFDYGAFEKDIEPVVRMMDNVVDRATYPLPQQAEEARSKRRMGLGVTGLANALEYLGHPYGSPSFVLHTREIMKTLRNGAYAASVELAKEKGPFPLYSDEYLESPFIKRLPEGIQDAIKHHGIRNSHLTSIAPTGTISICADNVSSGIEPVFSKEYHRTVLSAEGPKVHKVMDYGVRFLGVENPKTSAECSVDDHVNVLLACAPYVDSAISKTCNVPPGTPWEDFKAIYTRAWEGGAKGCTTFNSGGKRFGILNAEDPGVSEDEGAACTINFETGERSCE